jgi:hypothetical protein
MGAMSRRKGAAFEREVAIKIRDNLGFDCKRNLEQYQAGGDDLSGLPGWSIECKRYASIVPSDLKTFWLQCEAQAAAKGDRPVLIVKQDRKPIQVFVNWEGPGHDCYEQHDFNSVAQISFELWCGIVRETLEESEEK